MDTIIIFGGKTFFDIISNTAIPLFLAVSVVLITRWMNSRIRRLPPGVNGLPFLGYGPLLGKEPYITFQRLSEKYGNIYSVRLAGKYTVICSCYKSIKEMYVKPEFLGRPPNEYMSSIPDGVGIYMMNGDEWSRHRNIMSRAFKKMDLSNSTMLESFQEELQDFMDRLDRSAGGPIDIRSTLTLTMYNVMMKFLLGNRCDDVFKLFTKISTVVEEDLAQQRSYSIRFPSLTGILSYFRRNGGLNDKMVDFQKWNDFLQLEIEEHRRNFSNDHLRDYVDYWLSETNDSSHHSLNDSALRGNLQGLALFGILDMEVVLSWFLLAMVAYPKVQVRIQEEIDEIVGREKTSWEDRTKMPYTTAALTEVHRWKTLVPLGCSRYTVEDTSIGMFAIPKNTIVIPNLWAVHNDPKCWENPEEFRPERHLTSIQQELVRNENYLPFGLGVRQSPGKRLAESISFLYMTTILQRFSVQKPDGTKPVLEGRLGLIFHPEEQKICFIPRKLNK